MPPFYLGLFMTHKQLFVRELKQWLMPFDAVSPRTASADAISAGTLNALRCILIEIEEASVYVAISASVAGALADNRAALTPKHLVSYLPSNPNMYRRHIDTVLNAALSPAIVLPVQAYHARLSYALRLSHAIADAGPAPNDTIRAAELTRLEEAWRHVCGTALGAISVVREALASVRHSRPPVNNENAEALLRSAKAGGRPCVDGEGSVRMPRWAESRGHARHVTSYPARIVAQDRTIETVIENVSRTGLGLSGIGDIAAGTRIAVELEHGERIMGKIMWARGPRAGVQLDAMLDSEHPLLAHLSEPEKSAARG